MTPLRAFLSLLHIPPAPSFLADSLDGALEAGGGLQLQLVGHGVNLKAVETAGNTKRRQSGG